MFTNAMMAFRVPERRTCNVDPFQGNLSAQKSSWTGGFMKSVLGNVSSSLTKPVSSVCNLASGKPKYLRLDSTGNTVPETLSVHQSAATATPYIEQTDSDMAHRGHKRKGPGGPSHLGSFGDCSNRPWAGPYNVCQQPVFYNGYHQTNVAPMWVNYPSFGYHVFTGTNVPRQFNQPSNLMHSVNNWPSYYPAQVPFQGVEQSVKLAETTKHKTETEDLMRMAKPAKGAALGHWTKNASNFHKGSQGNGVSTESLNQDCKSESQISVGETSMAETVRNEQVSSVADTLKNVHIASDSVSADSKKGMCSATETMSVDSDSGPRASAKIQVKSDASSHSCSQGHQVHKTSATQSPYESPVHCSVHCLIIKENNHKGKVESAEDKVNDENGIPKPVVEEYTVLLHKDVAKKEPDLPQKSLSSSAEPTKTKFVCTSKLIERDSVRPRRKKSRPSMKKRQRHKQQRGIALNTHVTACTSGLKKGSDVKRLKTAKAEEKTADHKDTCNGTNNSRSPFYVFSVDVKGECEDTQSDCDILSARVSFSFGSSESDSDFGSSDEFDGAASSDALWDSFHSPMTLNLTCFKATSKPLHQSLSSPEILNDPVAAANDRWEKFINKTDVKRPKHRNRQVQFANDDSMVTVHVADDWERKGPWEEYSRDRCRFKRRIEEVENAIGYVFTSEHRQRKFDALK